MAVASLALRALLDTGATLLEAKLGAHVAAFGSNCFQPDRAVREVLRRPDGKLYHRESIGRARRALAERGHLISVRVHVGQRPDGAKFASAHGTTSKRFPWQRFGMKAPAERIPQERPAAVPVSGRPRHSAPPPAVLKPPAPLDPKLAAVAAKLEAHYERRWESNDAAELERLAAKLRGPPS